MRKFCLTISILTLFSITSHAQHRVTDSLRAALSTTTIDSSRILLLRGLATAYFISNPDSSIMFAQQGYELAEKNKNKYEQAKALNNLGNAYGTIGDYGKSLQFYLKGLKIYESTGNIPGSVAIYDNIGATYIQA